MASTVQWYPNARDFLRKLNQEIARRIFEKVEKEVRTNVEHFLETLVGKDYYKIRIGDYRLFVDYDRTQDILIVRTIRHRRDAYKK